ncbi:hypothetical protein Tco_1466350 [Tanacetum coccineum]
MTALKFADTHNMVAFFAKPTESKGFEQIVDFLNAHTIKYALTINPKYLLMHWNYSGATVKAKSVKGGMPKRKDTEVPQPSGPTTNVADEAVYKEMDNSLVRAATTASSLETEQDSGGDPRRQETMGDTIAQTRSENVSKLSNDPLFLKGNILQSGKDSPKLQELMELCTNLQTRVRDLKTTKTTQVNEIASLKRRVKKLERRNRSRTHKLKRLYKVGLTARVESSRDEEDLAEDASKQGRRIHDIDADEDITLENDQDDADMFDVNTLIGDEVLAEPKVVFKDVNLISAASTKANVQDKGKGKMIEPEKPIKKKELIRLDEEIASKLQAEFDEEVRLAREKAKKEQEANVALTEEWDDIQAKIEAGHELAQRLQAQEQEELSNAEKATLFVQLLEKRRKHLQQKEQKRRGTNYQPKLNKEKSSFKRVNTFVDFRKDLVEGSSKRAGTELEQEVTKKQKVDDVQETAEVDDVQETVEMDDDQEAVKIKELIEIVPDKEEVAIDVILLATKPPSIVD